MGASASIEPNAMACLNAECAKPIDASDVHDINTAKSELASARRTAQYYRNKYLPRFSVDLTGDGVANAIGFDTTGNGQADSFDTTGDGLIDSVILQHQGQFYLSPVSSATGISSGKIKGGKVLNQGVVSGIAASRAVVLGSCAMNGATAIGNTAVAQDTQAAAMAGGSAVVTAGEAVATNVGNVSKTGLKVANETLKNVLKSGMDIVHTISEKASQATSGISDSLGEAAHSVTEVVKEAGGIIGDGIDAAGTVTGSAIKAGEAIVNQVSSIVTTVTDN